MIKIGCAAYSYRQYLRDGRMGYEDFIEEAHRMRLDGVELTLYWLPSKEASYLKKIKSLSLLHGLPISCAGVSTDFCSPDAEKRKRMIDKVKEGLQISRELGAPCLRVFAGRVPEGHTKEEAISWTVKSLRSCVEYAEEAGVVIAMENHGGITSEADDVIRIIEDVGSPWLRVNLDLGNYRGQIYEEIEKTVPYAVHVHAKVSVAREIKVDYQRVKRMLDHAGYNGFLSIEYEEKDDPKRGVPRFARYLQEIFS